MVNYIIELSEDALNDLDELSDTIIHKFKAPLTAFRYVRELKETINSLTNSAESYPIQTNITLRRFGTNVRRINYKKMAIIYTVYGNIAYIHRIIPASMITGL